LAYTKLNGKFVALFTTLNKKDMKLPQKFVCENKHQKQGQYPILPIKNKIYLYEI